MKSLQNNKLYRLIQEMECFTCTDCQQLKPAAELAHIFRYETHCDKCRDSEEEEAKAIIREEEKESEARIRVDALLKQVHAESWEKTKAAWLEVLTTIFQACIFLGCWVYAVVTFGFYLGFGLGWIPSILIARIIAPLWPLFLSLAGICIVVLMGYYVFFKY